VLGPSSKDKFSTGLYQYFKQKPLRGRVPFQCYYCAPCRFFVLFFSSYLIPFFPVNLFCGVYCSDPILLCWGRVFI
jgi:hypothetical protein